MFQFGPRKQQKKKATRNLKKQQAKKVSQMAHAFEGSTVGGMDEDTLRDVSSSWSTTDRQMATLFSPSDSYQKLSPEPSPLISPSEKEEEEDAYQLLSPMPKDSLELLSRKTVTFRSDNWRLEQLEEQVVRLKTIVEEQADQLRKARKQVDQLIVDYSKTKKPPLKKIGHFESEPTLGDEKLFSDPRKHHTC